MAKRSMSEQLDEAVEAMMTRPGTPPPDLNPRLTALLRIAASLRDLPREDFKAQLKADLQRRASTSAVPPIPAGYHSATPCLVLRDAPAAIEFYKHAFGARELMRATDPNGDLVHAEIEIGDSRIAIAPEMPQWGNLSPQALGGSPVPIQLYVEDVDALAERAVAGGATILIPVADQFYGDRSGRLADPFGHLWIVATHTEDVSPDEMRRRLEAWTPESAETPSAQPETPPYVVEPHLPVAGAAKLIDFLTRAFGAEEISRHLHADGTIAHAQVQIGDSRIGVGDAATAPSPTALHLYVEDADATYHRAVRAGATSLYEPTDQDYGDREASVTDPSGNRWYIGSHRGPHHVPEGLPTVMSYLHPHGAPRLIDFMTRAFNATELFRAQSPDGIVHHAKIRIGQSVVEMGEAQGPFQPMPTVYHLYVDDTDAAFKRARAAGGIALSEPADQPWGFRNAGIKDPGGNEWWINAPIAAPVAAASVEFHNLTPFLTVHDVHKTVEFLRAAFDATVVIFDRGGDPPHDHAEVRIGESMLMIGEVVPGVQATSSGLYLRVANVDAAYQRALRAKAASVQAPRDMPWGARMAHVRDAFGNSWFLVGPKNEKAR